MTGVLPVYRGKQGRAAPKPDPVPIAASWATDFRLAIDPCQIVEHRAWRVAKSCALTTIEAGSGLVVVLGAPGTGKTLLLNDLARRLEAAGRPYTLLDRGDLAQQPVEAGVGLIDEADRIDPDTLAKIVRATDRCHVLVALPRFIEQITGFTNPMTVVSLAPLTPEGIAAFVAQRLAGAGRPADLFSLTAMAALVEHSGGIPRVITMLAGGAISLAAIEGAVQVTAEHVEQVMTWRGGLEPATPTTSSTLRAAVVTLETLEKPAVPEAAGTVIADPTVRRRPIGVAALAVGGVVIAALALHTALAPWPIRPVSQQAAPSPEAPAMPQPVASIETPQPPEADAVVALAAIAPAAGDAPPFEIPVALRIDDMPDQAAMPEPQLPAPTLALLTQPPVELPVLSPPVVEVAARTVLPTTPPARVRIQYPRGDARAEARAQRQAAAMRAAGLAVEPPTAIRDGAARPGIRYFFAEDRDAAADVARRVEGFAGDIRLIAPSRREGLPRPGTVEVLLSTR